MVLGTYRTEGLSRQHPLLETLAQLARVPRFQRIALRSLSQEDVGEFIQHVAGTAPPQSLAAAVHSQTEGNPLFVTEVVRLLAHEGVLRAASHGPGDSHTSGPRQLVLAIPEGIREVIGLRLNKLSETCVQVLAIASVMGREFGLNELDRLIDHVSGERLLEALEEAHLARLIEEAPQAVGRYQFSHILIRETLYDDLTSTRRARLHRRAGEALEELYSADLEPHLAELAYHFLEGAQGGDYEKAIAYCVRAAERDVALLAYEEAAAYYQKALRALEYTPAPDKARRRRLHIALGEALMQAGDSIQAREAFQQAAGLAWELGSSTDLAHAALGFEEAGWRPGLYGGPAARLLNDALRLLGEEDSPLKAKVLGALTRALYFSGAMEQANAVGDEAMQMARRVGDSGTLAEVLNVTLFSLRQPEQLNLRLRQSAEAIKLAQQRNDIQMLMSIRAWVIFDLMELGELSAEEMDRELEDYRRHAEQFQQPFFLYVLKSVLTVRAISEGRFKEAEQLANEALATGRRLKGADASGVFGMHLFAIRREQGRLSEIAPAVELFIQQYSKNATWRPGLALIYSELGMEAKARAEFEHLAADDFARIPQDALWVVCIVYLAEVCAYLGDAGRAAVLYRHLLRHDRRNVVIGGGVIHYGAASRYLGLLATTMSRWEEAEEHFQDALDMGLRTGARTWLAHAQHDYANMLLKRSRPGDAEKAKSLLEDALFLGRRLGMRSFEERVETLQRQAGARMGERLLAHPYPNDLTEREVEVLRLLAEGRSNRDIAQELFISPNTAANHVKNILAKTGSANRTEAAAYAMRHNLT